MNALTSLLKIKYPIIQAPMAGSDNAAFVAAACNAGILGSLGAQYRTPDEITKAIADIRKMTDKPFAVNLFAPVARDIPTDGSIELAKNALKKYYEKFGIEAPSDHHSKTLIDAEEQFQCVLDAEVPVFSFTLGFLPERWIKAFKEKSIVLIGTATNVDEAESLETSGVDFICAQSCEAGGHRGTFIGPADNSLIGGMALIPQVADAVHVPVIAAGGIMDGRGIAAAIALGASGVQMGTAFLTATECPIHQNYKDAVKTHRANETEITSIFSGGPARGILNKFIEENRQTPWLPFPFQNLLTKPIRAKANSAGEIEYTNLWSGQNGYLARQASIEDLIQAWIGEYDLVLTKLKKFESEMTR